MKKLIAIAILAASAPTFAATIYDGRGNIYQTNATLADLQSEATRLNTYTHGNSVAIQYQGGQITDLQADQRRQDAEFKADQYRQDQAQLRTQGQVTNNQTDIARLNGRASDQDLILINHEQTNQRQNVRLDGHDQRLAQQDQVNEALSTSLAGMYTDMSGLRGEVRQAQREAKQARAGAAAALAVAGHQFDIHGGFQTAISAATMGGYQALAIGAGGAISDRVFINAGLTTSSDQTGAVLSGTYSW